MTGSRDMDPAREHIPTRPVGVRDDLNETSLRRSDQRTRVLLLIFRWMWYPLSPAEQRSVGALLLSRVDAPGMVYEEIAKSSFAWLHSQDSAALPAI
jgi:hypothetical protein